MWLWSKLVSAVNMIARMLYGKLLFKYIIVHLSQISTNASNEIKNIQNFCRNTQTVGITSLGLEHTQLLGTTYRDIAWQKSGIIKSGSSVFSTHQNDECIPVLLERACEKNVSHVSCIAAVYCSRTEIELNFYFSNCLTCRPI